MTHTVLSRYDPAASVTADAGSPAARDLLDRITAEPRPSARPHPRPVRFALVSGAVAAAAIGGAVLADRGHDQPAVGPAGFVVSRHADGSVTATMQWSRLSDPAALQRALNAAGARTEVFVETHAGPGCTPTARSVPYSAAAVQWNGPANADPGSGLVVHPDAFPAGGTFVVVVTMAPAGQLGMSTLAPGFPQITGILTYMAVGPVGAPAC